MKLLLMDGGNVNKLILGDCLDVMSRATSNSVDAIITDPPYGLEFMGKDWDKGVPGVHFWQEMIRVLKPGGYLLASGGTRTYHRMASAIEDAGFEIRDMIEWVYGSGFPKSLSVGKAVDKLQGNEREITGTRIKKAGDMTSGNFKRGGEYPDKELTETKGTSPWEGWGTALKPAHEPICMARKPLAEKTVALNVLKYGTGGINIDESRVSFTDTKDKDGWKFGAAGKENKSVDSWKNTSKVIIQNDVSGRFPANLIHDGSDEVKECFPNESERFFKSIIYQAKASKSERMVGNNHPTVKPIALMEYLIKMVTPKGGTVLDPFMGSGSTGVAALKNNYNFIGIELSPEYLEIAKARIDGWRER